MNGRLVPRWHTAFSFHSFFPAGVLLANRTRATTTCSPGIVPSSARSRSSREKIPFPASDSVARPRFHLVYRRNRRYPGETFAFCTTSAGTLLLDTLCLRKLLETGVVILTRQFFYLDHLLYHYIYIYSATLFFK